jgi:NarL family two-component system response regulator LiaR
MSGRVRVLIVDDHAVVREGLQMFLSEAADEVEVIGQAGDGAAAVELAERLAPDVILMDVMMPGVDGIEATRRLRDRGVESRVIILTTFADDRQVREAVQAGAIGYLMKDVLRDELLHAVRSAAAGRPTLHPEAQQKLMAHLTQPRETSPLDALTDRERDVLELIASGKSNKAIASTLGLSLGTVKGYVSAVLAKLEVNDRTQAALLAVKLEGHRSRNSGEG